MIYKSYFLACLWKCGWSYSCDASIVNSSIFFWRMAAERETQQQVLKIHCFHVPFSAFNPFSSKAKTTLSEHQRFCAIEEVLRLTLQNVPKLGLWKHVSQCSSDVWPELQWFVQDLVCRVELHGHAQSAVGHVVVAVLRAKRLVGDLEARRAVYRPVDPRHLGR